MSYGVVTLRKRVYLSRLLSPSLRSLFAIACAGLVGLALSTVPLVGVPASIAVFATLIVALKAWPVDLVPARYRHA